VTHEQEDESLAVRREEREQARAILGAPPGYSTVELSDAGSVRLLVRWTRVRGAGSAVIGVGEPLASAERAQHEVARTFALAGSLALLVALAAGVAVAGHLSRPLREMAHTAAAVDAGELSHRIAATGARDEVRVLADAFDHMLDRLEDAFARQRSFVSDASHELRTPLTVLRGQLEVLARQPHVSTDDVRRVEATVRPEILRMQRLVDDLLLLAQADEHEAVHLAPVSVRPFFSDLHERLRALADRRFEVSELPDGTVPADADRISQVVGNLVRNAVEHTGPGGLVRLEVAANGTELEVAVEDDGPGIPPEERARIFDRFHRSDRGARASGGAGLGLAIARAVVEAHDGRIEAGASAAGGARVAFAIPGFRRAEPAR
jgi:signal transduction histidine kinase